MRTLYDIQLAQWPHGLSGTYQTVANKIKAPKFDVFFVIF